MGVQPSLCSPDPSHHLGRELPPSGENIISFPACSQMFILFLFLFSLCKGFLKGTSSFGKPAVTQKNLLVLSPTQVKQPKKHDKNNKLIPYTSSPVPCVYIINLKLSLFAVGAFSCYVFVPCLKEQDAASVCRILWEMNLHGCFLHALLPWSCPSHSCSSLPTPCIQLRALLSRCSVDVPTSWSW